MPENLENLAVATGLRKVSFHSIPKKGDTKECSNYCAIELISHISKLILKILQARLWQYVNWELSDIWTGFRKGRGTGDNLPISIRSEKHPREFQKNIYFFIVECARAHFCVDHNKLWKILKEMGIPDHLSCLLRNLYASQEKASRTGLGTMVWFQIGK